MFMGGIVVENDVDRLASRNLALDGIEVSISAEARPGISVQ
jgi:hypothetical protein